MLKKIITLIDIDENQVEKILLPDNSEKFDAIVEKLDTVNQTLLDKINPIDNISEMLKPITDVCNIILHPKDHILNFLTTLWNGLLDTSYWIVAIGGSICIILYICGHKKAIRYTISGTVIYTIIQSIGKV